MRFSGFSPLYVDAEMLVSHGAVCFYQEQEIIVGLRINEDQVMTLLSMRLAEEKIKRVLRDSRDRM